MEAIGKDALAAVIGAIRNSDEEPAVVAQALWPDFKGAVAGALEEIKEEEAEGIRRWREAQREKKDS